MVTIYVYYAYRGFVKYVVWEMNDISTFTLYKVKWQRKGGMPTIANVNMSISMISSLRLSVYAVP